MTTQADALVWTDQQVGKTLDWPGSGYGAQCIDLICYYVNFLGLPIKYGNAADWWESYYNGNGSLTRLPATSNRPQPGDIVVFVRSAGNGNAGHIAIVREVYANSFKSLDQNWYNTSQTHGSPAAWVNHAIDGYVLGYLRPKFTNKPPEEPMFNEGDRVNANYYYHGTDKGYYKNLVDGKHTYKDAIAAIWQSSEYQQDTRFNEGDRINFNFALYGEDRGEGKQFVDGIWKPGAYGMIDSDLFNLESRINDGDIVNINAVIPGDFSKANGLVWKPGIYKEVLPNVKPNSGPAPKKLEKGLYEVD